MRGIYEQQWQEAIAGASIHPSEGVWENIVANLDRNRGRNSWVTILMIAATVTIAFAFPLTIGNSSFESRPDIHQYLGESEERGIDNESDAQDVSQMEGQLGLKYVKEGHALAGAGSTAETRVDEQLLITKPTEKVKVSGTNDDSNHRLMLPEQELPKLQLVSLQGYRLSSFDLGNKIIPVDINNYYFIPFYLPAKSSIDRSLLASLNMGTGSLSASSGFNGFGSMKNADFSTTSDLNANSDNRVENPGSTYYFGTGIELPIGKRWSLLAGLGYLAQKATGSSNIVLNAGNGNQPLGAYDPIVPGTIFLSESYNYSVTNSYINVPITIKYPFFNRKIKFRGGIGISTDFMVAHVINSDTYGKASYNPASMEYKTVVLTGLVNLDLTYSLNKHYAVALETGLRKNFTAIVNSKDYYPSSFTVGLILFYKIQ